MAAQKGRTLILAIGTAASNTNISGQGTTSIALNNESVDITNKDSSGYRELLEGGGTQSVTITTSGTFLDSAGEETFRGNAFSNSIDTYTLEFPNGDTLEGSFQITSYSRAGEHNSAETYDATLESSGQWTYTTN